MQLTLCWLPLTFKVCQHIRCLPTEDLCIAVTKLKWFTAILAIGYRYYAYSFKHFVALFQQILVNRIQLNL